MLDLVGEPLTVLLIGAAGGLALGLAARLGRLCTLGMIEDVHYGQDYGRMWMWVTALGTAMLVNFAAEALGFVDLSATLYLGHRYSLLGAIVGGLLFGYGMAQAGNCGYGVLARLGGGDIRALMIAIVMGVTASAAIFGVLGSLRPALFPLEAAVGTPAGFAHQIESLTGLSHTAVGLAVGALALVLSIRFQTPGKRALRVFWGCVAGAAVSSGFIGTWHVATNGFEAWPVSSHSFTAPIGETIHYAMFSSGLAPKFGMGSVLGVVAGSMIGSFLQDGFRWEACDDPRELRRQMGGAVAMGLGAVLAAGCSVGQGMTALSLLSLTAPVVAASIWVGAWLGLRHLIGRLEAV
ncbi:YeeE/YedE family protein [Roseibacterium sp. SDUM158017]|uniref:YeeE/YedE family protein n=1 Tax=Roseicyclus salinarum TaxID=3036773 RepID=UPI002414EB27|nr:YeeE/YedE family protein [Roseibacterium sp. SDUM158017]MDG4649388.1 YeeE/YedE family protein [Roseibacterium sp. SDUM158017]